MTCLTLNAAQTAAALPFHELVPAVALAAQELAAGTITAPERLVVPIDPDSVLLCMPATADDVSVTKIITVHARNARNGLPAIQGEVIVMETSTGRRLVQLDGPTVTARRTAAVSMLGIQTLLGRKPQRVLLIGTGAQAQTHVAALVDFFGVSRIAVQGSSSVRAQAFCDAQRALYADVEFVPLSDGHTEVQSPLDVLIALTTSRQPVIPDHLGADVLAIGVGAFKPDMAEFGARLLHSRPVVVDCIHGAQHEAGDLLRAKVDWSQVRSLASQLPSRASGTPMPVLKTVGQAAWDLAAARVALRNQRL